MITRRDALKTVLLGSTALLAGFVPGTVKAASFSNRLAIPPLDKGAVRDGVRVFDLNIQKGEVEFFKGFKTPTLGVNGNFLGPSLKMRKGEAVRINVSNNIGEPTTMHWHGMHVPAKFDGGPHQVIRDGETWPAEFEIKQLAATCWYHPHMIHKTGEQVWKGIAGLMLIEDEVSDRLDIPSEYGVDDIPVVLQDRLFNDDKSFRYVTFMHDVMMGMKGDTAVINGTLDPYFEASTQKVRLRLLNGSNARFYNLGFDDGRAFHQIATDGSFLARPFKTSRLRLGPGERAEIVVDVSDKKPIVLRTFVGGGGMMGMMRGGEQPVDLLQIRPAKALKSSPDLPAQLAELPRLEESQAVKTRRFVMDMRMGPAMMMGGGSPFSINGKNMDMKRIDEVVKLGDTEIWEIVNRSQLPHPFHIHDIQFLILDRNGKPPSPGERGYKDTVTVNSNETVRFIAKFDDYADPELPYMYHCHILEHEDAGMMGQFVVKA